MKFCVIGAGTMGSGIAQTIITSGFETIICDTDAALAEGAGLLLAKRYQSLFKRETGTTPGGRSI